MINNERIIIIGGGSSIKEGEEKGLWEKLSKETTIATNYAFNYITPTICSFVDFAFFSSNKQKLYQLPLLLTKEAKSSRGLVETDKVKNIIMLKDSNTYSGMNSFSEGFYCPKLVGLFSLTFAIQMGFKNIYLLGYDFGSVDNNTTHFYESELKHRGVGFKKVRDKITYNTTLYEKPAFAYFDCYKKDLDKTNIYNVSLNSKIESFKKISYDEFFFHLDRTKIQIDQNKQRIEIISHIAEKTKGNKDLADVAMVNLKTTEIIQIVEAKPEEFVSPEIEKEISLIDPEPIKTEEQPKEEIKPVEVKAVLRKDAEILKDFSLLSIRKEKSFGEKGLIDLVSFLIKNNVKTMVEVGSYAGESSIIFANKIEKVFCVDAWNDKLDEISKIKSLSFIEDVFDVKTRNFKNIKKMKILSQKALHKFKDLSLDFVYIDITITEKNFNSEVMSWLEKVKVGGFLAVRCFENEKVMEFIQDKFKNSVVFKDSSVLIKK